MLEVPGRRAQVTLVIGSGSVKCAAVLGVAKVLAQAGIGIERVVGCSAGAIFATLIAQRRDLDQACEATIKLWTTELTAKRNISALFSAMAPRLMGFSAAKFGLRSDRKVNQRLQEAFGDLNIEDMPVPLHITATDFASGELVELTRGPVWKAVRASIAIPFAFSPYEIDGRQLVDGFVSDPLPISVAIRAGARVIVAIGFESPLQERVTSAGRFAFQLSSILANNLLRARFAFNSIAHHSEVITIVPEFTQRIRLFDTEKLPYIIETGAQAAREQIHYLRRLLDSESAPAHAEGRARTQA